MTWKPIETAPLDGSSVLLFTTCHGVCEAWFERGKWSDDTPISPAEYYGDAWVCCDDEFQVEVEMHSYENGGNHHGSATHWMPLPDPPEKRKT